MHGRVDQRPVMRVILKGTEMLSGTHLTCRNGVLVVTDDFKCFLFLITGQKTGKGRRPSTRTGSNVLMININSFACYDDFQYFSEMF